MSKLLCNFYCNPDMIPRLEKTFVREILPDIWEIEGYCPEAFFLDPPSGNIYVMRDGDMVMLMDTGHHPFYRPRILEVLKKFVKAGAKELVLVMSHGHWDHGKNNDVIYDAGFKKVRFLLPENEIHTLNISTHMIGDMKTAMKYFDPCADLTPGFRGLLAWASNFPEFKDPKFQSTWNLMRSLPDKYDHDKAFEAWQSLIKNVLASDLTTYMIDKVEPLKLKNRVTRKYGSTVVSGWPVGRFFLIHDASQSPGHICIYDSLNKFMITGDATLEINMPFMDADFGNIIKTCRDCLTMTEEGYITFAADSHRSTHWGDTFKAWGSQALDPVELLDYAKGKDQCLAHYKFWLTHFSNMWDEIIRVHKAIGEATVNEIIEELKKSTNKYIKFRMGFPTSACPIKFEVTVAKVLMETGARRRVSKGRILFTPAV